MTIKFQRYHFASEQAIPHDDGEWLVARDVEEEIERLTIELKAETDRHTLTIVERDQALQARDKAVDEAYETCLRIAESSHWAFEIEERIRALMEAK